MDNLLKGTLDAISESDNEIGGNLLTRLIEAHLWGRSLGEVTSGLNILHNLTPVFRPFHVGLEIDLLAKDPVTGNEGRYRITAVSNESVPGSGLYYDVALELVGGGAVAWTATEEGVEWRVGELRVETTFGFLSPPGTTDPVGRLAVGLEPKEVTYGAVDLVPGAMRFRQLGDPATGVGYLTLDHREDTAVIEARRGFSALDKLRRAFLIQHAEGEELDRIGRNYGLHRPLGISDAIYRNLLLVIPYGPRGTIYMLELALQALYPLASPPLVPYEDLVQNHNTVFLLLPDLDPGSVITGRTFLNPAGPVPGATEGRDGMELATSATAQSVATSGQPEELIAIRLQESEQELDMLVLPSGYTPAWTYVNEGALEAATFSIGGPSVALQWLAQVMAATADGGGYRRTTVVAEQLETGQAFLEVSFATLIPPTLVGGRPWRMTIRDAEIEYGVAWGDVDACLEQTDGTEIGSPVPISLIGAGTMFWKRLRLERTGSRVRFLVDGQVLLEAESSSFDGSAERSWFFGHKALGAGNQDWVALWDHVRAGTTPARNYWNLIRSDGVMTATAATVDSAASLFLAANGDLGKHVRLNHPTERANRGRWRVTASSAAQITLDGIPIVGARVTGRNGDLGDIYPGVDPGGNPWPPGPRLGAYQGALIELDQPGFEPGDGPTVPDGADGRRVVLTGSGASPSNNGTYPILEYLDPWTVRVDNAAGFVDESGLTWQFSNRFFATATGVTWELVAAGTVGTPVGTPHTLRDTLPGATIPVEVGYSAVRSAQLLEDEFVSNVTPNLYYPFYLIDIADPIRQLLEDLTAAGVIAEFARSY